MELRLKKMNALEKTAFIFFIIWVLLQIIFLFIYWNHTDVPDASEYIKHALEVCNTHELYPSKMHMYDRYTHAPGLVNFLALLNTVFGTVKVDMIINFLMSIAIIYEIFYLANKLFNKETAYFAVILYTTLCSTWFVNLHILSDHPSYFLFLTGLCLSTNKKWYYVLLASICYALSYTIRPTVMAFIVGSIIIMLFYKRKFYYYLCLVVPYLLILYGIGKYNESRIDIYTNTSSLGGFGLMHSVNEETSSYANMSVFNHKYNSAYIENAESYTFAEKDSIWKARSIELIKKDPIRLIKLAPLRLLRQYSHDAWTQEDIVWVHDYENAIKSDNPKLALTMRYFRQLIFSLSYYFIIFIFIISLIKNKRDIFTEKGGILIILLLEIGVALISIAEIRSHYAFLFVMAIWAAYYLHQRYKKFELQKNVSD